MMDPVNARSIQDPLSAVALEGETAVLGGSAPGVCPEEPDGQDKVPLAVDLDGTLIATDSLLESAMGLMKQQPWVVLFFAVWLLRGKAVLKSEIARRFRLNAEQLPYRPEIIAFLQTERVAGRTIVLATAAHQSIADAVSTHLGLFNEVLASNESINLKGFRKRDELVRKFGVRGFDYIGDSRGDVLVWSASRIAHVVAGPLGGVPQRALTAGAKPGRVFAGPRPSVHTWLKALRIHQWVKNVLIFIPTLAAHHIDVHVAKTLGITFLAFSFIASAAYVVNDLFDLAADRRHPQKRRRPFASGQLTITQGVVLAFFLMVAGFGLGAAVSLALVVCLFAYQVLTFTYSSFLKNKPILDVMVLALIYTLRVFAGGIVSGEFVSAWLFQFSIFLFLSLAFVKRYSELQRLKRERTHRTPGRGYRLVDLHIISQAGVGSGLLAGLVLALYVNGLEVQKLYPHPHMLWGVSPMFVYWITRVWLIAHRGNMPEDPILYAFHDKVSYIVGFLILCSLILGMAPYAG